jgi:N-acetylmuramoyl-L-alanine amidase
VVTLAVSQQQRLFVKVEQQEPVAVSSIDSGGVVYVSLTDFAVKLNLPGGRNDVVRKYEFRFAGHRIKFTSLSPFVVVTEVATNSSNVFQLPQRIFRIDTVYFAPVGIFQGLFDKLAPTVASFDTSAFQPADSSVLPPPPFDIAGIEVEKKLNGYLLTVLATRKLGDFESWLKPDGWLFVTVANAKADTVALKNTKPFGAIREILAFQSPTSVQITFRVSPDLIQAEVINDPQSNNLLVSLRTQSETERAELEKRRREMIKKQNDDLLQGRSRYKLDVIVLDAGHGGKDPGTIGVAKTHEKDVALGITLKLGALIEKNLKGVKVVYTRKTDKFIELYRRGQIANEAGGKLFISIHCNSMEQKPSPVNGFEIYLLRPEKTGSAIDIAARENAVINLEEGFEQRYKKLTEEDFIILTMSQNAYVKYSERFAEIAANAMANNLKIRNSGVKQAGFFVLVGASMPNVLVEAGYLSNTKEEKFLKSKAGQQKIAEALFKGIKEYKASYERTLLEGTTEATPSSSGE